VGVFALGGGILVEDPDEVDLDGLEGLCAGDVAAACGERGEVSVGGEAEHGEGFVARVDEPVVRHTRSLEGAELSHEIVLGVRGG